MNIVAHNLTALNSQRQFGINSKYKAKSAEKLSSGYRINRAADDAAGLAISEKMRRQIRGLSQGIENTQDGVSLCQVADGALAEVNDMLHRIEELSVQSANGTNSEQDREYIQEEIQQLVSEIDRIGSTTDFNGQPIFDGRYEVTDYSANKPNSITKSEAWNQLLTAAYTQATSDIVYKNVTYKQEYLNAYLAAQSSQVMYWDMCNSNIKYDGPGGTNTNNIMNSLKAIAQNDFIINEGLLECNNITTEQYAKRFSTSKLVLKEADNIKNMQPSQAFMFLSSYHYDISGRPIGNFSSWVAGDIQYQVQEYNRNNSIPRFDTICTSLLWNMKNVYFKLSDDFSSDLPLNNSSSTQDTLLSDYMKIQNLLKGYTPDGDINDEMRKNGLWIQSGCEAKDGIWLTIDKMNSSVLSISNLDVSTVSGSNRAISATKKALQKVSANRSKNGAQQNRLEHTIANESNIVENTTAAESRIRDTDMAKEMVVYSNLNILEQAGFSMMSQANQSNRGILQLLQ